MARTARRGLRQLPNAAPRAAQVGVRRLVVHELLLYRVPLQRPAAFAKADVADMADRYRPIADLRVANGLLLLRAHALHEIPVVVVRIIQPDGVGRQWIVEQALVAGTDDATANEDPAILAVELHAIFAVVARDQLDIARIGVGDLELLEGVEAVVAEVAHAHGFDGDRTGPVGSEAPLRDVVVVRAPVRHHAAAILQPLAEVAVRLLEHILGLRRRTLPEVPIEVGRDGLNLERAADRPAGKIGVDCLDLAETAVSDELAGESEPLVGALLAAGLEDTARLLPHL